MAQAAPITCMPMPRRVSEVSTGARRPSPGGGPYSRNAYIDRLERSADELSMGGSDIGEEIRKMNEAEKERSRQNSIQSSHHGDISVVPRPPGRYGSGASRTPSAHTGHSMVDASTSARWGGYSSPGGCHSHFVTSPVGSVRSGGSWSHTSAVRSASGTTASRLAHMVEPMQEGNPLNSPLAPSSVSLYSQEHQMSRQSSQTSFSRRYDHLATEIEEQLQTIPATPSPQPPEEHDDHAAHDIPDRPRSSDTYREAQIAFKDFDGVHYDPDKEEYVLEDDEGHELRRVSARTSSGSLMDAASLLRTPRAQSQVRMSYGAPPPDEGMVFYPAPVPRMLNLPKRLSQQAPPSVQAKRRSQMLAEMSKKDREAAPWIPPVNFGNDEDREQNDAKSLRADPVSGQEQPQGIFNERMSMHSVQQLPPQLRASMFFEHPSVPHDVEVQNESAVATLDSILAASATAPVSAFTHHPYAGDVQKVVYAAERPQKRRSATTTPGDIAKIQEEHETEHEQKKRLKKRRSSSIGNFFRRNSIGREGETREESKSRPVSRGSVFALNEGGNRLKKRKSQMSLGSMGDEVQRAERSDRPDSEIMPTLQRRDTGRESLMSGGLIAQAANVGLAEKEDDDDFVRDQKMPNVHGAPGTQSKSGKVLTDGEQIDADFEELEESSDIDLDDPIYAQPTTLLAELQVRKAQLRSRNRTAATAYPTGMHSTLLQLDAVEAINAKKRQKQKIALAWEDPNQRAEEEARMEAEDEDVPLGVLFPSKEGLIARKMGDGRDWDRPLGLMAKREMEENEPLSSRRTRLNPNARPLKQQQPIMSQLHLAGQPDADEAAKDAEDEGETLGQRLKRLKIKEALDSAIKDVAPETSRQRDSTFSADVLDQFPELNIDDAGNEKRSSKEQQATAGANEEETLGQRRARLQREREASGMQAQEDAPARPALRSSASLANLLSSNPTGMRPAMSREQQLSQGTLLHTAGLRQMKSKQDLLASNMRSTNGGEVKPLVDAQPQTTAAPMGGLLAQEKSRPANGAFQPTQQARTHIPTGFEDPMAPNRSFSTGLLGMQRSRPANGAFAGGAYNQNGTNYGSGLPGQFGMGQQTPYFASPTAGAMYGYGGYDNTMSMMGYGMPQQQQMVNPSAYYALSGGHVSMMPAAGTGFNVMTGTGTYASMAQNGMLDSSLDPNQKAAIDRWRLSVAPS